MASYFLAPDPLQSTFFIPGGAVPGNGAQLFIYVAGSTTKQTVAKDNAGASSWSNPIVLDSGGNLPSGGVIWIPSGVTIKAVYAPSNDTDPPTSPYRTIDNINGINDTTVTASEWQGGPAPTFVSATQFTLVGDQTGTFKAGRRIKSTNTAGTIYSTITQSSFGAVTTVNVQSDSGSLDSGLSAVSYSLIDPQNPSINADYVNRNASSVATQGNGTTNIWGTSGNTLHLTGTNTVFNFSTAPFAGARRTVIADAAFTLKQNVSSMALPGAADISVAAGDRFEVLASTTANNIISMYQRASGSPVSMSTMTNSIGADVALSSTPAYFDGPTVAQGSTGIWFASGTITLIDTGGAADFLAKLHDGTNIVASAVISGSANFKESISLSGYFTNPPGNIRISARDSATTTGAMKNSASGLGKDSTINVLRIA